MPDQTNKIYAPLSQAMDSETESNNANTLNDCSIGSLSTLEADDHHHLMMISGKLGKRPMSPGRKLCFISSIVFLLGLVMIFLFVLPCPEGGKCRGFGESLNWVKDYDKLEMRGPVNVIRKEIDKNIETSLIFMYKGDKFIDALLKTNPRPHGIISIVSKTGKIAWFAEMGVEPRYVNCSIIDVDLDGETDCLIVDAFGQLSTLKSVTGQWIWKTLETKSGRIPEQYEDLFNFPLLLPDLDDDKVNELLHIFSSGSDTQNSFSLLSGKTGKLIGNSIKVDECMFIYKLELAELYTIKYTCINSTTVYTKQVGLYDLYKALTQSNIDLGHLNSTNSLPQYRYDHEPKSKSNTTLQHFSLIIENQGKCPENCNSSIQLFDNNAQLADESLIYNFSGSNMYTHFPEPLDFHKTSPRTYGFVFKYLQWSNNELNTNVVTLLQKIEDNAAARLNKSEVIKVRLLKETVVLIVFTNSHDLMIENTSQSHVMQFCRLSKTNDSSNNCQPKINSLDNSLLISDLDNDGSKELLTFYTTFSVFNNNAHVLKTYVQLLNLENEIPKLYGARRRRK
uniref:CSON003121 protein n=1 Tax=Culicoides sonorensis TaxID=179676 RepID=A0A336LSK2_CULSO